MVALPRALSHVLRGLVFLTGLLFGLWFAGTVALFGGGGGPMYVRQARFWVPLIIALAAPFLWVLAHRHGDRWTAIYLGAWLVFIATVYVLVWIF